MSAGETTDAEVGDYFGGAGGTFTECGDGFGGGGHFGNRDGWFLDCCCGGEGALG